MDEIKDQVEVFEDVFAKPGWPHVLSATQVIAVLIFVITVCLPTIWFIDADFHGVFKNPKLVLLSIISPGLAVCMVLIARIGSRSLAFLSGLLMGAGCAGMVILANSRFADLLHFPQIGKLFQLLAVFLGALPGLAVWLFLVGKKRSRDSAA